ncbi:hypothetical protein SAMD00019534_042050 [Acytostelium subglobosum LB1]|uniref:hypothetical protein n=1 Tax=Acytostelium subglobosum LB1 TaxID=1410327 RepID=UPI00064507F6|nr:hypothetical protein SAMD00019534_042050 [Acytostelium subglobosum LB1]GAM21030.1 hypothetical protein SAMD00019534_042050 [Acytostelium subglobosum LB1]|eukprot:XP_012756164.1 hypothetical protein SAMD00019534_042050 [Acytostelium subglobosum LB1]
MMDTAQNWTASEWYATIQAWRISKPIVSSSANAVIPSAGTVSSTSGTSTTVSSSQQQQQQQQQQSSSSSSTSTDQSDLITTDKISQPQQQDTQQQQQQLQQQTSSSFTQAQIGALSSHSSLSSFASILSESNILATPSYVIVEILLKSLKFEKDDILRINILLFLQENSTLLLEEDTKRFERVFNILQSLVNSQTDSYPVKSQVLSTMTTILICESIIKTHPRLVESFVDLLFDIINKINNSPDRLLRGSACLCLMELELTYPRLLSSFLPTLLQHVQNENTHLIQSYTQLFTTILQHTMISEYEDQAHIAQQQPVSPIYSSSSSGSNSSFKPSGGGSVVSPNSTQTQTQQQPSNQSSLNYKRSLSRIPSTTNLQVPSLFAEPAAHTAFAIPHNIKYAPMTVPQNLTGAKLPESVGKELLKCISVVVDQSPQLNQWGLVSIIQQLVPLVDIATISPNVFRHPHLYKLFFIKNPLQFHLLLFLALKFPEIYSQEDIDTFFNRLINIINDVSVSLEARIIAIDWLLKMPSKLRSNDSARSPPLAVSISRFYTQFYPSSFDTLYLKEVKLYAMCKCIMDSAQGGTGTKPQPPSDLLKSLICLDEFRYHKNDNAPPTRIVFSILLQYLISFPAAVFKNIESFLSELLVDYSHLLNNIISLLNGIPDRKTRINLFLSLSKVIVALKPNKFLHYLSIVERIILEDHINPTALLNKVHDLVRRRSICATGDWVTGNTIISICRRSLIHHNTQTLFKPLRLILSTLSAHFSNLEIRDRARFYDRMLTHLPDDKIKSLLTTQGTTADDSNISGMSMSSLSTMKIIKSPNNYISITPTNDKPIAHHYTIDPSFDNAVMLGDDADQMFQEYHRMIKEFSHLSAKIVIPYRIRYKPNQPPVNFPPKVYALLIQFKQATPLYAPINPIRIPYLCYPESEDKALEFPYCFNVDITFHPHHPMPSNIKVKMVFNNDEGKTCKASASTISVQFQDIFMQVPVPSFVKSVPQFRSTLFDKLWKLMVDELNVEQKNPQYMHSVKYINVAKDVIVASVRANLGLYLIEDQDQDQDQDQVQVQEQEPEMKKMEDLAEADAASSSSETNKVAAIPSVAKMMKILVFLPPQHHMLLLFTIHADSTIVHIKTDYWRALSYIDPFLKSLTKHPDKVQQHSSQESK